MIFMFYSIVSSELRVSISLIDLFDILLIGPIFDLFIF